MPDIIKGDAGVMDALAALCTQPNAIRHTEDSFGNGFHWYTLDRADEITGAAKILKDAGARLAIIAAYNRQGDANGLMHSACYEFVLKGVVYGVTVNMDAEHPSVPSITTIFANADWHEREMMELYGVNVTSHPNPRRLFLDEELDKGLLGDIVPLSIMMNGSTSNDLWERTLSDRGGQS